MTTYTIHTRSVCPGLGYCDRGNYVYELLLDNTSHPYVTYDSRNAAQVICDELNERYPAADLIVMETELEEEPAND